MDGALKQQRMGTSMIAYKKGGRIVKGDHILKGDSPVGSRRLLDSYSPLETFGLACPTIEHAFSCNDMMISPSRNLMTKMMMKKVK